MDRGTSWSGLRSGKKNLEIGGPLVNLSRGRCKTSKIFKNAKLQGGEMVSRENVRHSLCRRVHLIDFGKPKNAVPGLA